MKTNRVTIHTLKAQKQRGERITMLTAYDATFARLLDEAGIDILLVGDSLGMVVQGHDTTLPVTLDEVIYHCRAVARGATRAQIVGDMPFMSYQASVEQALVNAGRMIKEGGAHAIKLEGGAQHAPLVAKLVDDWRTPGEYSVDWSAKDVASGSYFVLFDSGTNRVARKLQILK